MQTTSRSKAKILVDWAAVVILIASIIIFTAMRGTAFFSVANAINILRAMSTVTIFALAATVSMAPDGFDMAAGTLGSFCAYVFASLFLWFNMPLWLAIVLTIVFAMVMYLLNMFLILVCKVPDMLATCALQFVHQGLGLAFTGGGAISAGMSTAGWAAALKGGDSTPLRSGWTEASQNIGKSPYIIIIMLICVAVCFILLERTKYGRYLYAMGGNKTAAKLSGINVKKMRFMAGMFAAAFIAIGGIVVCSRNSAAQVNGSDSYLMTSLAAVFIGRSIGGREKYNAIGTAIGALLISTLENGMTMCGVPYYILPAMKGAVLCLALIAAYITTKED
ncbi:MAG TPA: ABC transporter permease [Candidatus Scatomonas pullistercoris]|uniref:ABC transporter permease n=1 Tax=Candidatus Scatomonas pullistercoris TaxID=2840920 RepID=A0A9D1P373_9FIRM|nr:ABC transporter permease [Candidatus Scatomonas pullistercoris]